MITNGGCQKELSYLYGSDCAEIRLVLETILRFYALNIVGKIRASFRQGQRSIPEIVVSNG